MDINKLAYYSFLINNTIGPQCKELNIIVYIIYKAKTFQNWVLPSANCIVNVMYLNSHDCWYLIIYFSIESRQRRNHNYNSKFFIVFVSFSYSVDNCFWNFIFNANKKLVLNIDKLLCLLYKLYICISNWSFCLVIV